MRPYTGKSQREKDEEFDKREKTKERKIKMKNKKGDKK